MDVKIKSSVYTSFAGVHPVSKVPFSVNLEDGTAVCPEDVARFLQATYGVEIIKEDDKPVKQSESEGSAGEGVVSGDQEQPAGESQKSPKTANKPAQPRKRGDLDA